MTDLTRPSPGTEFPPGFLWGAATSAYQVEGSPLADHAGPSIWHRFCHTPGRIADGGTGDVACDHYRRFREDIALMKELGAQAYRFSIAWGRVLPQGTGRVNRAGLAFYDRLVDELLEAGITPMATLYHWDLPAALDDRGGWQNPDIAWWFASYVRSVVHLLGDRVRLWVTLNEPFVVADAGYMHGVHAPGHRSTFEAARASCNLMRAHGAAVQAYRAEGRHRIGLAVNLEPKYPASDSPEDLQATARADAYWNKQYLDPILLGRHPGELREVYLEAADELGAADCNLIRQPIDFLGVNYFTRSVIRDDPSSWPERVARVPQPQQVTTELGWEVYPQALIDALTWVRQRYGDLPLYITEIGAAFVDPPSVEEGYQDPLRIAYLRDHLLAARAAIEGGVRLKGYFAWSLLDNFEWSAGFTKRFGLVHVDYATQKRTVKGSGRFYSEVVRSHGASLQDQVR
jgi:beta-glucosidase